jgi:hypothetical protein
MTRAVRMGAASFFALALAATLTPAGTVKAASDSQVVAVSVSVLPHASLSVSGILAFQDGPSGVTGPHEIVIDADARTRRDGDVQVTLEADGDLRDEAGNTIPPSALSWTASGDGFLSSGTVTDTPQPIAFREGPGSLHGSLSFSFRADTAYRPGNYTGRLLYTITAP